MKFIVALLVAGLNVFIVIAQQPLQLQLEQRGEVVVKIEASQWRLIPNLGLWSIEIQKDESALLYLNQEQYNSLLQLNIPFVPQTPPSMLLEAKIATSPSEIQNWDAYPDYDTYVTMMQQFAANYPQICRLDTFGYSKNNRLLLALKISDQVADDESEPEFLYSSSMHGDELTGYVLMLRFADYLLTNYEEPFVKNLVDNIEIYINPLANPDGTFRAGNQSVTGATRSNANNVDLNRNFPNPLVGDHPDGKVWQPENLAMMDFLQQHSFSLSMNFHGGAEVMNYPWDTYNKRHADTEWLDFICRAYADTAHSIDPTYLIDLDNGVTNGYDWYEVFGSRQDYVTYYLGGREITGEISYIKLPDATELPGFWDKNYKSLLYYLQQSLFGVTGLVTDAEGNPIQAEVEIVDYDLDNSQVKTQGSGVYYRYLKSGIYNFTFTAEGFEPKSVSAVVNDFEQTTLNVILDLKVSVSDALDVNWGLYPNPAKDKVYIETQNIDAPMSIEVYNAMGKRMYQNIDFDIEMQTIDVSEFPKGVYFVQLFPNGKSPVMLKFVVE